MLVMMHNTPIWGTARQGSSMDLVPGTITQSPGIEHIIPPEKEPPLLLPLPPALL